MPRTIAEPKASVRWSHVHRRGCNVLPRQQMWRQPRLSAGPGAPGARLRVARHAYGHRQISSRRLWILGVYDLGWSSAFRAAIARPGDLRLLAAGVNGRDSFLLNLSIIPKSAQPVHLRFAPEPGHLPLGVIAMSLLRRHNSLLPVKLPAEKLRRLLVAERSQGTRTRTIFLHEHLRLLHQPRIEHALGALVDALVERLAFGIEPKPQNVEAAQRVAPLLLPKFRHFLPRAFCRRGQADFDRADQLGGVVGMNFSRRIAVKTHQNSVKIRRPAAPGTLAQAHP